MCIINLENTLKSMADLRPQNFTEIRFGLVKLFLNSLGKLKALFPYWSTGCSTGESKWYKIKESQNSTVLHHIVNFQKTGSKIQAEGSDWTNVIIPGDDKTYTEKQVGNLGYNLIFHY